MNAGRFVLLILAFSASCHPRQEWPGDGESLPWLFSEQTIDSVAASFSPPATQTCVLKMERTGCGGPCDEWVACYYAAGVATLVNEKSEWPKGAYRTDFHPDSLHWVWEAAQHSGFFHLPDTVGYIPQLPGWKIAIVRDSLRNEIFHNHGGPLALHRLENRLEKWIMSQDWEWIYR